MKKLLLGLTLLASIPSFASELTAIEAAFLAGVEMGKKGEITVSAFLAGDGHVLVEKKNDQSFSINFYDGYDCSAEKILVKANSDSNEVKVTGALLECN